LGRLAHVVQPGDAPDDLSVDAAERISFARPRILDDQRVRCRKRPEKVRLAASLREIANDAVEILGIENQDQVRFSDVRRRQAA